MVAIKLEDFAGAIPRRTKRLLPPNFAFQAVNCSLDTGALQGIRSPDIAHVFGVGVAPARVFRLVDQDTEEEAWAYSSFSEAELVKSPLINDSFDRWYLFEPGAPPKVGRFSDFAAEAPLSNLAFSQPVTAPVLVEAAVAEPSPRLVNRVYVYTYITEWGEESRPSPAATITVPENGEVTVSGFQVGHTEDIDGRDFETVRIYRSVTGAAGGALYFVADISWATSSYLDDRSSLEISFGATLAASSNDPVSEGVYGAKVHPSGALVAFRGRDVYFSRPYLPHAWPEDFRISVADQIVALEVFGQQVLVMTKGRPSVIYGQTPGSMGLLNYPFSEPCVSYNSVVPFPDGVYYGGRDGLIVFGSGGPQNMTSQLITRDQWGREFGVPALKAARSDTRYVATVGATTGFVIDKRGMQTAFITLQDSPADSALSNDVYTGDLYMASGNVVYRFDPVTATRLEYEWVSKEFVLDKPSNLGALVVLLDTSTVPDEWYLGTGTWGPGVWEDDVFVNPDDTYDRRSEVLVTIVADGVEVFSAPVRNNSMARLPNGFKAVVWQITIVGARTVYSLVLSEVGKEQAFA